jgi:hypothetical protein
MNIEEAAQRFNLSDELTERIKEYNKMAENAEVKYCEDHDIEYYDFESCYACKEDKMNEEEETV